MTHFHTQINSVLERNNKTQEDIMYVTYAVGNNISTRKLYCCNFESFLDASKFVEFGFEFIWPYDIKFVGDDFWIGYDSRNAWVLHQMPERPSAYRTPTMEDLIRKDD